MEILKETPVKYVSMDINVTSKEERILLDYAKNHILNDKTELLNWAFIEIVKNTISSYNSNNTLIKESKKNEIKRKENRQRTKSSKKMGKKRSKN